MAEPVRTCIGCRERGTRATLVRAVFDAGRDAVVWDVDKRLPGRGAWLHEDPDCFAKAVRRKAFARALRRVVEPGALPSAPG